MKRFKFILGIIAIILCGTSVSPAASKNATSRIPKELVQQPIKDINTNENNFRLSKDDLKIHNEHLKYELHDLNGDSRPAFFLYIEHAADFLHLDYC